MKDPLRERRFRWWGNVFVLPDGKKINPFLVLVPVFLVVGYFTNYLYQQGQVLPSAPLIDSKVMEASLQVESPIETVSQESTPSVVEPVAVVPPSSPSLVYSIRVGKGHQLEFVHRSLKKLRKDDQDAFFQKVGDQYWVLVGRFAKIQEAQDKLDAMTESGSYAGEVVTLSEAEPLQSSN